MLKVLIVDDEFYFRESLKHMIDWKALGYTICGEASNGQDAINIVKVEKPAVILLDINMPIINGLILAEMIKQLNIQTKIIIITGYNDFEYAKQAIKLNVYQYISKPIDEEELIKCLIEINNIKTLETSHFEELENLKNEAKIKYYHQILQENMSFSEVQNKQNFEQLQSQIFGTNYQVALISFHKRVSSKWHDQDINLWYFAILNILGEIELPFTHVEFTHEEAEYIIMFIGADCDENKCIQSLKRVMTTIENLLKLKITISLGSPHKKMNELNVSYERAVMGMRSRILLGGNPFISCDDISNVKRNDNCYSIEDRRLLLMFMQSNNMHQVEQTISKVFLLMQEKKICYDLYMGTCSEIFSTCMEYLSKNNLSAELDGFHDRSKFLREISGVETLEQVKKTIFDLLNEAVQTVQSHIENQYSELVQTILIYIHENFRHQNLSINRISDYLFVNYGHLCRVFKREIGVTVNEYITNYRTEQAKMLFQQGNKVIFYVSENVGYSDANYFSKCFKKATGFTPSDYIESI